MSAGASCQIQDIPRSLSCTSLACVTTHAQYGVGVTAVGLKVKVSSVAGV